jgi:lipoate-protein ligase A
VTATWRLLIDDGPVDGAWSMALDRAIQLAREAGQVPPTLRLYRWVRPTVTLGRFQEAGGIDRDVCANEGIDVVRRFTGGRGVLHDDELTYSLVASVSDGVPRGTSASYRMLCSGLVGAYRQLGVEAALTPRPRGDGSSAACYLHSTAADLSLGARKLSGSAQIWHGSTVLQHGSFTLTRDVAREARVFRLNACDTARLARETAAIAELLEQRPVAAELERSVIDGISAGLGVRFLAETVTRSEIELAEHLVAETTAQSMPSRRDVTTSR